MKTIYNRLVSLRWLWLLWLPGLALPLRAQLNTPPFLQWQRVIEGGVDFNTTLYAAKSATGEFGVLTGTTLTRLTAQGAVKWSGPVEGSVVTSTNSPALKTSGLVPTADGGFLVQANDASNLYLIRKDANGNRIWSKIIAPSTYGSTTEGYTGVDLIQTLDGGYLSFATHYVEGYEPRTYLSKFDGDGNLISNREPTPSVYYPPPLYQGPTFRVIYRHLALPDGGYLQVGGDYITSRRPFPTLAIAERYDAQGKTVWSRLYYAPIFFDVILNPDGSGSFIINGNNPIVLLSNGDLAPGSVGNPASGPPPGSRLLSIASDGSGQPSYVMLSPSPYQPGREGDFQLSGFNQQNQVVWSRTPGGSQQDLPQVLLTTGDGYLLVGTTNSTDGDVQGKQGTALATWVVKLTKAATALTMTAPTYNCQTGAIAFNTTGGNETLITYLAPGITRSSVTDNFGTVEPGLRGDPKVISITAEQSGVSTTYNFDLKAACSTTATPKGPVVSGPIPDQFLTQGQDWPGFAVGQYFRDPTTGIPNYAPNWSFDVSGLPYALYTFYRPTDLMYSSVLPVTILGTPTMAGVYTVTITARTAAFPNNPVSATFRITVSPFTAPGGALTLIAPTYDCATGAFTFRTTGGDGSLVEYQAPGITGWTSNPNQFVDKDSRTASDVQPFQLMARQNGIVVTYTWDLKAACGRARLAAEEPAAGLQVRVLGNPVVSQVADLEIRGVPGQRVQLDLIDGQGRTLHQHTIGQAGSREQVGVPIGQSRGLFFLHVQTDSQHQTLKLIKP